MNASMDPGLLDSFEMPWPEGTKFPGPMVRAGMRMSFFFDNDGFNTERRRALMTVIDEYLVLAGPHLKLYLQTGDGQYRKVTAAKPLNLAKCREGVEKPTVPWSVEMSGAEEVSVASNWGLVSIAAEGSFLSAHFPLSAFVEPAPHTFRALFQRWCSVLRVHHAYGGFGLQAPTPGRGLYFGIRNCGAIANRFPGLDVDHAVTTNIATEGAGIRCVNWLTAVDDVRLEKVGGPAAVLRIAGDPVTSMPYEGGAIFVAGERPDLGDTEQGLFPKAYGAIGRALKLLRVEMSPLFVPPPGLEVPAGFRPAWFKGFYDPSEAAAFYYTQQYMARFDG